MNADKSTNEVTKEASSTKECDFDNVCEHKALVAQTNGFQYEAEGKHVCYCEECGNRLVHETIKMESKLVTTLVSDRRMPPRCCIYQGAISATRKAPSFCERCQCLEIVCIADPDFDVHPNDQ